jgi:Flp pilus assembly protein TadD
MLAACLCVLGSGPARAQQGVPLDTNSLDSPMLNRQPVIVPANVAAVNEANLLLRKGDKPGALKRIDAGLEQFPKDAQLRFLRAVVLGDLGRSDEAVTVLEGMMADFPELPEPYNNLAVIRANQGRTADAEHLLLQSIAAQSTYATARENLGDLYVAMAVASYDQAGKLDPANAVVKKKLEMARDLNTRLHRNLR